MTPERETKLAEVLSRRRSDVTVVLENVFDPHNIAAVMRTCDAVGVQEVFAITDRIPPRSNWGYRSSRSANKWVDLRAFHDREECMEVVRSGYARLLGACPGPGVLSLYRTDLTRSVALVFGNEKYGVSDWMRERCDGWFSIPQCGMLPSLNVSVACGVVLYEMFRQREASGKSDSDGMPEERAGEILRRWSGGA